MDADTRILPKHCKVFSEVQPLAEIGHCGLALNYDSDARRRE
jgi:hypothetical protein